jgi:peptidyl-prolyl cis-trans isomerase C
MSPSIQKQIYSFSILFLIMALPSCIPGTAPVLRPTLTLNPILIPTPTQTPIPLALSVNGEDITAIEFDIELARYQQAHAELGITVSIETATQAVLSDMVDSLLLGQAASANGFVIDDGMLQTRIDTLAAQMGGLDVLANWESANGYTDVDFRTSLHRQIAAAWMRDQITASVTNTAEQVHVKQILLYNEEEAQQALEYLQAGWIFDDLAAQYDSLTKGELGWFPRGYLSSQVIEEAAFALQPGQYSPIIQDGTGFHLLFIVERESTRQLSPDALLTLQERAVQSWLIQRRNESTIIYAP